MRIRKTYNGVVPNNKIVNSGSNSTTDTYSCNYLNPENYEITLSYTHTANQYTCVRIQNIVMIYGQFILGSVTADTNTILGSVPDELKPSKDAKGAMTVVNGSNGQILGNGFVRVKTTGEFGVVGSVTVSSNPLFMVSLTYTI